MRFLITDETTEQARIWTGGLYLATSLAIRPVSVRTMTKSTFRSRTVWTAAAAIDSAVPRGSVVNLLVSL